MTKLTDTQTILLSAASQREREPVPAAPSITGSGGTSKAIAVLLRSGYRTELKTRELAPFSR